MRARMRVAVMAAGGAALAVLALLIATAVTGSQALAWVTGTVGLLAVAGTALLALKMVERYSRRSDQTSTRTANLEKRVERSGGTESKHAEALTALGADVEALRSDSARARQVAAVQKQVSALERTVKILHRRVPQGYLDTLQADVAGLKASTGELERRTGSELSRLDQRTQDAWTLSTESAFQLGRRPRSFLSVQQAMDLFEHYQAHGRLLEAGPLLKNYGLSRRLDLGTLRSLYRFYKASGYWDLATLMLQAVAEKSGRPGDQRALTQLRRDVAVFSRPTSVSTDLPTEHSYSATGPIVHMVGRMLPETQSGFTLRTHYTARAQSRGGLPVVVAGSRRVLLQHLEMLSVPDEQQIERGGDPLLRHAEAIDERLDALVLDHRGDVTDCHRTLRETEAGGEGRVTLLDRELIGIHSVRHHRDLSVAQSAVGGFEDMRLHHLGEREVMVRERAGHGLRILAQGVRGGESVGGEKGLGIVSPPLRRDRPRQPRLLPETSGLIHRGDAVGLPDGAHDERVQEVRVRVQNARPERADQFRQLLDVLAQPGIERDALSGRARKPDVLHPLMGVPDGVLIGVFHEPGLADDHHRQPTA